MPVNRFSRAILRHTRRWPAPCSAPVIGGGGKRRGGPVLPQRRGAVGHRAATPHATAPCGLGTRAGSSGGVQQHGGAQAAVLGQPPEMRGEVHVAVPGEQRPAGAARRQPAQPVIHHRDRLDQRRIVAVGDREEGRRGTAARASRPTWCPRGTGSGCRRRRGAPASHPAPEPSRGAGGDMNTVRPSRAMVPTKRPAPDLVLGDEAGRRAGRRAPARRATTNGWRRNTTGRPFAVPARAPITRTCSPSRRQTTAQ